MRDKLKSAIIQQAIFRWENAVMIAAAILLTAFIPQPFDFWPIWGWGLLAALGVFGITISGLFESEVHNSAVESVFYQEYDPYSIKTANIRNLFMTSLKYRRNIEQMINGSKDGAVKTRLSDMAQRINQWTSYIFQLAKTLDAHESDTMLNKDVSALQTEITKIEASIARENNRKIVEEAQNLIASKRKYMETINELQDKMRTASLQFSQSLDVMATVYAQLKLVETRDLDDFSSRNLESEIDNEVNRMSDLIDGLQKAYVRDPIVGSEQGEKENAKT